MIRSIKENITRKILNLKLWLKHINVSEFFSVFISAVVSATVELLRQVLLVLKDSAFSFGNVFIKLFEERRLNIFHSILNIFLITAIVWCITGIISMLKVANTSKSQLSSLAVFLVFTFSVSWYTSEIVVVLDQTKFYITSSIVVLLYFLLFTFFCYDNNLDSSNITNDYAIAAELPEKY